MTSEEIVAFAEGLARIAAAGGGPKALAAHLAAAIGGGVLVEDVQWQHVAAAGANGIPPSARPGSGARAGTRTVQILGGGGQLGWLSAAASGDVEHAMRLCAAAIGVELARESGGARRRTFWERLASKAYHDADAARDDAAARGITVAPSYLAVAFEAERADDAQAPIERSDARALAAEAFRSGGADLGFLERGSALVVFVPVAREIDASNARTAAALLPKSAAKRAQPLRVTGGAGTIEPLFTAHRSLAAAQAALSIGRRLLGPGKVALYDELGAYPLLYEGADTARLRAFAGRVLAPLRAYDEKHQTELERTLRLYFEVGENVKTAAAQLNVHRHTVFYRLRQIGEICGASLERPGDQLTLRMAVTIDALHS
ncbi:MAG TPA: helix-turn-helix domain-containing protein [Verrucomicrobiae bacterium]|nr:helix-turn-helix domain-containing protein [Verrucomicrobiae bacterium]